MSGKIEMREIDEVICILVKQGYPDLAHYMAVLSASENDSRLRVSMASQDRDNRRRRMELAQAILDESVTCDLEAIAAIVWPVNHTVSDPTQIPTQVADIPCATAQCGHAAVRGAIYCVRHLGTAV